MLKSWALTAVAVLGVAQVALGNCLDANIVGMGTNGAGIVLANSNEPVRLTLTWPDIDACPVGKWYDLSLIDNVGCGSYGCPDSRIQGYVSETRELILDFPPIAGRSYTERTLLLRLTVGDRALQYDSFRDRRKFPIVTFDPALCASSFRFGDDQTSQPYPVSRSFSYNGQDCKQLRVLATISNFNNDVAGDCGTNADTDTQNSLSCPGIDFTQDGLYIWTPTLVNPLGAVRQTTAKGSGSVQECAESLRFPTDSVQAGNRGRPFTVSISHSPSCWSIDFYLRLKGSDGVLRPLGAGFLSDTGFSVFSFENTDSFPGDETYQLTGILGAAYVLPTGPAFSIRARDPSNADLCAAVIGAPDIYPARQPATLYFTSADTADFSTTIDYTTDGTCGDGMFIDFALVDSSGVSFPCQRLNTLSNDVDAVSTLTCSKPKNTMAAGTWQLQVTSSRDGFTGSIEEGPIPYQDIPYFEVIRSDNADACISSISFPDDTVLYTLFGGTAQIYTDVRFNSQLCQALSYNFGLRATDGGADISGGTAVFDASGSMSYLFSTSYNEANYRTFRYVGSVNGAAFGPVGPEVTVRTVVFPDTDECAASIQLTELEGTVDFLSTDTSKFTTRITYTTDGTCERGQYIDFELSNSAGASYRCDRFIPVNYVGESVITCDREKGSMSTMLTWQLTNVNPPLLKRVEGGPIPFYADPTFQVTHSNDPSATGGMRKRQRQVQAGLELPSDLVCPATHEICAIAGRLGTWECLDTRSMLDACGGCPMVGGQDCTDIAGVARVTCEAGVCIVHECDEEHRPSSDRKSCVAPVGSVKFSR